MKRLWTLMLVTLLMVLSGCGEPTPTPKTEDKAAKLLKDAEAGNPEAQFKLGGMYLAGRNLPQDLVKAAEWYHRAAVQGHAEAQFIFAGMYALGCGVPKDPAKAAEWTQKAAVQGDSDAQYRLG